MIMVPSISVIIPVYNTERYIRNCFESLQAQTFQNFEVIVIDDGSQDDSISIAKEFLSADRRFKLFLQKNQGPSAARNNGFLHAKGKYIYFLDSDDYIHPETFEKCIKEFENNDIDLVTFDGQAVIETQYKERKIDDVNFEKRTSKYYKKSDLFKEMQLSIFDWLKMCFYYEKFQGNTALYMIKKDVLETSEYLFNEKITYYEDALFFYFISRYIKTVKYIPYSFYFRRFTGSSLMTTNNDKKILQDILFCIRTIEQDQASSSEYEQMKSKMFRTYFLNNAFSTWQKCDSEKQTLNLQNHYLLKFNILQIYVSLNKSISQEYEQNIKILHSLLEG